MNSRLFLMLEEFFYKQKNTTTPEISEKKQPDAKLSPFSLHLARVKYCEKCWKVSIVNFLLLLCPVLDEIFLKVCSVFISMRVQVRKLFAMEKIS